MVPQLRPSQALSQLARMTDPQESSPQPVSAATNEQRNEQATEANAFDLTLNLQVPETPSHTLAEAIQRLGLPIEGATIDQLDAYCKTLWSWNEKLNLTRHTDYDTFVRRDLLDSFVLSQQLDDGEEILDIGTGGGVPGLPIAIMRPEIQVSVCDSVAKKAKAVEAIVNEIGLNVPVHAVRAQLIMDDLRFSSVVSRAAGSLKQLLTWVGDYWVSVDRLLAIKGPRWIAERGEARHLGLMNQIELRKLASYPMPGTESESVILQLKRVRPKN
ncbi:MAG: hypothetical protein Aurels2KO_29440 [Aureliella sp.]